MMGMRPSKLPRTVEREVPVLFPQTQIEPTAEELRYYQTVAAAGRFAFCIDRQSLPKKAKGDEVTGMKRRVCAIANKAETLNLKIVVPELRANPQKDELPFLLEGECLYYFFVDGTNKRATGYAANQNARPKLWRAFLLAQALAQRGCGPTAFIVGEGTRFFRDPGWLTQFVRALWRHNIEIHDGVFGKVDTNTLTGYIAYISAVSGWLGMVSDGARTARRKDHRIFHNQPPFGLCFSPERDRVFADVETHPILEELVERMWDLRLKTTQDAAEWTHEIGYPHTQGWVVRLLHKPILEGRYRAYDNKYTARLLKQQGGLLWDLDITEEGGNRRWLVTPREGDEWRIEYPPGTHPIDPQKLRAVRARISRAQGRPRKEGPVEGRLIEPRMLRCICNHSILERRGIYPNGKLRPWSLTCRAVPTTRVVDTCSKEAALEKVPEHVRFRNGYASGAIWSRLVEGLLTAPIDTEEADTNFDAEECRLEQQLQRVNKAFTDYQEWVRSGHEGDMSNPHVAAGVNAKRSSLSDEITAIERQLEIFASKRLTQQRLNASIQEARKALAWVTEGEVPDDLKREIINQVVDHVVINLATGEFTIHVSTTYEVLQSLSGRVSENPEIMQGSRTSHNFAFLLQGQLSP